MRERRTGREENEGETDGETDTNTREKTRATLRQRYVTMGVEDGITQRGKAPPTATCARDVGCRHAMQMTLVPAVTTAMLQL
jgi:hypothetical protein